MLQSQFLVKVDSEIAHDIGGRQDSINRRHIPLSEEATCVQPNEPILVFIRLKTD